MIQTISKVVENVVAKFKQLGYSMTIKEHILHWHLDYFPQNLGALSEEQRQRFYEDIKDMEWWFKGRWNINMTGKYFWMLTQNEPQAAM